MRETKKQNNLQIGNFVGPTAIRDLGEANALGGEGFVEIEEFDFGSDWFALIWNLESKLI